MKHWVAGAVFALGCVGVWAQTPESHVSESQTPESHVPESQTSESQTSESHVPESQKVGPVADQTVLQRGKNLFVSGATPACAICHTLADVGATGPIGPNLDELAPTKEQVKKALQEGVGAMPSFAETLSAADMEAVATYVVKATGGGKQDVAEETAPAH